MNIFEFDNYKEYVLELIRSLPAGGHGQMSRIAAVLGIQNSVVSQIFRGSRNLSLDQAFKLAQYFGLSAEEADYFIEMVQVELVHSTECKAHFKKRLKISSERARLGKAPDTEKDPTQDSKVMSVYCSSWEYAAVHALLSIRNTVSIEKLAHATDIPRLAVKAVVDFLSAAGLAIVEDDRIRPAHRRIHLQGDRHLLDKHHLNWRLKSIERIPHSTQEDLFFSFPMSIASDDFPVIRKILKKAVADANAVLSKTKPDRLACLNIDWFKIGRAID